MLLQKEVRGDMGSVKYSCDITETYEYILVKEGIRSKYSVAEPRRLSAGRLGRMIARQSIGMDPGSCSGSNY
eukprot:snap_masked-scaffold_3-processed-gene-6.42-mRNA-1 protein AED:1.00 eAED:1.00 QI:0/0/0/0/1/1/2/0/71